MVVPSVRRRFSLGRCRSHTAVRHLSGAIHRGWGTDPRADRTARLRYTTRAWRRPWPSCVANPTFDFRSNRIGEFLRENPNALDDDTSPVETRASLRAMQRLFDVAPPFDKHRTVALFAEGIARRRKFVAWANPPSSSALPFHSAEIDAARTVYANAAHKADTALMLLSQTATMNPTAMKVLAPQLFGRRHARSGGSLRHARQLPLPALRVGLRACRLPGRHPPLPE